MTVHSEAVSVYDIRAARRRLEGVARVTPVLESPLLNRAAGRRILVKAESLQITGSFKLRGAWSALSALSEEGRRAGVIAYSSGNHAQGVAHAAACLGIPAVIVMPEDAPEAKRAATEAYGAEVVLYDRAGGESREAVGAGIAEARGLTLVKPYDDPLVIAGQGTAGLELAQQAREMGVTRAEVLVCCGGGGLSAGVALALAGEAPGLRVRTVEPEGFDDVARSLATGGVEANRPGATTVCDAIMTPGPGELTLPILRRLAGPGLAVSDAEALAAMEAAFRHLRLVAEPGGAAALAGALFRAAEVEGDAVICLVTGGNVDPATLCRALGRA
jgi:threonine dehydratase